MRIKLNRKERAAVNTIRRVENGISYGDNTPSLAERYVTRRLSVAGGSNTSNVLEHIELSATKRPKRKPRKRKMRTKQQLREAAEAALMAGNVHRWQMLRHLNPEAFIRHAPNPVRHHEKVLPDTSLPDEIAIHKPDAERLGYEQRLSAWRKHQQRFAAIKAQLRNAIDAGDMKKWVALRRANAAILDAGELPEPEKPADYTPLDGDHKLAFAANAAESHSATLSFAAVIERLRLDIADMAKELAECESQLRAAQTASDYERDQQRREKALAAEARRRNMSVEELRAKLSN